jgi:acetyl-CoA acyltransferase
MAGYSDRDAVIVGAVRTPVGKGKGNGALHDVLPVDLPETPCSEPVSRRACQARRSTGSAEAASRP